MQPFEQLPHLSPYDFGSQLSQKTPTDQPLNWKKIFQLASKEPDPSYYILRLFGLINLPSIQTALMAAGQPKWASACACAHERYSRALSEIRKDHLPVLIRGESIFLTEDSAVAQVPGFSVLNVRPTIILACLQAFVSCHPMPVPQAFAWGLHKIVPIAAETDNMKMSVFLEGLESKITQYEKLIAFLFAKERPFPLSLTQAQWYDIGLVMTRYSESRQTSRLKLLIQWSRVVTQARKSVEALCNTLKVQALLPGYPPVGVNLKSSIDRASSPAIPVKNSTSLEAWFQRLIGDGKKTEGVIEPGVSTENAVCSPLIVYQRGPECVLSESQQYSTWRNEHIFKMLCRSIFFFEGQNLPDAFIPFTIKYKHFIDQPKLRMRAVFFLERVYDQYVQLRHPTATFQLEKLHAVFKELADELEMLLTDDHRAIYPFLYAALLVTHLSTFFHFSLDELLTLFDLFYTIQNRKEVSALILEKTIHGEGPIKMMPLIDILRLFDKYAFTSEQKTQIIIKYQHYGLGLRRQFLNQARTLDFVETLEFITALEQYMNGPLSSETVFLLLKMQYLKESVQSCFGKLQDLRLHIRSHINSRLIPQLKERLIDLQNAMLSLDYSCPTDWENQTRKVALQIPVDILNGVMYSTLLCGNRQTHYTRFVVGITQKVLEHALPHSPLLGWCNVHQQMISELAPDNRALYVDVQWSPNKEALALKMIGFHSVKHPSSKMALVKIDLPKALIEQEPELVLLIEHLFPLLCDEELPSDVQLKDIQDLNGMEYMRVLLLRTKGLSLPKYEKWCVQLLNWVSKSPAVAPRVCQALVNGAEQLRKAMRKVIWGLATATTPANDLLPDPRKHASEGHISEIPDGFTLNPAQEYNPCYGVMAVEYKDAITQALGPMINMDHGKMDLPCYLEMYDDKDLVRKWGVTFAWEKKTLSCPKGDLTHFENEKENISFTFVTLSLVERPEIRFTAKYASKLTQSDIEKLLLWHLAQLKVEYYGLN